MIRIVVAEDQAMVLGALAALLDYEADLRVVAQATDGAAALDAVVELHPDVLVTDIEMPGMTGLELAAAVRTRKLGTKVVILTTFARPGYLRQALEAGASAYLLKAAQSDQLADAVRRVHAGGTVVDPELAADAWGEPNPLTPRERQALRLAGAGRTGAQIAAELGISEGTVRNYLSEAMSKLEAANRVEAARIALERGWL